MITSLDHAAISVADLDLSIAFYRDLLGLKVLRVLDCPPRTRLDEVVDMPGCTARIAHLQAGATMLELFEYRAPAGRPIPADCRQADLGWIHAGFASTDVRADHARLAAQGVRFIRAPLEFRPGVWICYFYGPDGEVCELRQTPPDDGPRPTA